MPAEVNEVIFVGVIPSASNNSKVFAGDGFLTVNISVVCIATELFWALIALNLICWPSFKWGSPAKATTPGLATERPFVVTSEVVDKLSTVAVAPEVSPVIFSTVVNDILLYVL